MENTCANVEEMGERRQKSGRGKGSGKVELAFFGICFFRELNDHVVCI